MPYLTEFRIRTSGWHDKYELRATVMDLFKKLGEYDRGRQQGQDPNALAKMMRLSPDMRRACTDTISHLAKTMHSNGDATTITECTTLIEGCTTILSLSNLPAAATSMSLMVMPAEVRNGIYKEYIKGLVPGRSGRQHIIFSHTNAWRCSCAHHDASRRPRVDVALARVSKTVMKEVLACWFSTQTFHFSCTCELRWHLLQKPIMLANLRYLKVHWTGPMSDVAFKLLAKVTTLRNLDITISKSTTDVLSRRERLVRSFFTQKGQPRLTDALGLQELAELRNLKSVDVYHVDKAQAWRRTNEEAANLEAFLRAFICKR